MRSRILVALLCCLAAPLAAQGAPTGSQGAVAIKPGQVTLTGTYIDQQTNRVLKVTMTMQVVPVAIASIELFNTLNPLGWTGTLEVGKTFCMYPVAKDSAGNQITGVHLVFASSDTTVVKITPPGTCYGGDTTVRVP